MEINLDDLKRILADGRVAVSLAGATCIHCNVVSRTVEAAAEHDARCEKHPMAARIAALEAELAEARKDGERLDWLARRTHWVDERMHLGLRGAIDAARGAK